MSTCSSWAASDTIGGSPGSVSTSQGGDRTPRDVRDVERSQARGEAAGVVEQATGDRGGALAELGDAGDVLARLGG
jgi:hypothetical protein